MASGKRSRQESEQKAKAAHLKKMSEVAKCIVDPTPGWLPEVLSDWSFEVKSQHSIEALWPTRREMWDILHRSEFIARELSDALLKAPLAGFIVTSSDLKSEDYLKELAGELAKFAAYAGTASKSRQLVGKNGKVSAGATKLLLPNVMSAKYLCAAIIAEVASFFAGYRNSELSKRQTYLAIERFWMAWPLEKRRLGTDPTKSWARYLTAADDPRLKAVRAEVRRHLAIHANRGN
jgi:hypothetical protein